MSKMLWLSGACFMLIGLTGCGSQSIVSSNSGNSVVSSTGKLYALSEVATHNQATDCWQAIEGKVYNVSSYVNQHPGGPAITRGCGQDATTMFDGVGKHAQIKSMLAQFYIGDLK